ncbi:hypothetical protein [Variovorax sp. EL159]|uniref:hypothetical protein n=1 Tax=Variovorax sp. EL159 TaxID=1566270 RepID=UPI000AD89169|nr:hypothetical protein [Variovorax sp. EL159]
MIEVHPHAGRIPEELENLSTAQYRQVVSGMNRIIYEVRLDTAYIHLICDTRRDLKRSEEPAYAAPDERRISPVDR